MDVLRHQVLGLVVLAVIAGGCSTSQAGEVSDAPDSTAQPAAASMVDEVASRVLIDVRTPAEHAEGHLAGSLNIDVNDPGFVDAVDALPRDDRYLVYCRSGNRSAQAIGIMAEMGFTDLVDGGGYDDLLQAGAR
jgi:phage shock protein E